MSETAISRVAISRPLSLRTLRLRLFWLTFVSLKLPEVFRLASRFCGVVELGSRPRSLSGHSIFMISAPSAPSQRVAHGPALTQLKSTTRMFSSARGRDMESLSCTSEPPQRCGRRLSPEHSVCLEAARAHRSRRPAARRERLSADRPAFGVSEGTFPAITPKLECELRRYVA